MGETIKLLLVCPATENKTNREVENYYLLTFSYNAYCRKNTLHRKLTMGYMHHLNVVKGPEIKVLMNTYCGVFMCHVGIHQNFDKLRQGI